MSLKVLHTVTQADIDANPELASIGVAVGEQIEITSDSVNLVGPRPKDRD